MGDHPGGTRAHAPVHSDAEREALARITPEKALPESAQDALAKLEAAVKRAIPGASVALGGSVAKGTNLAGDHDVDVFVRFPKQTPDAELSDMLDAALRAIFPDLERVHGSRDYFHVLLPGGILEAIPVLDVETWEEAANVTDMSPLHVAYVRGHVERRPWLAQEIRLAKQFMKAAKVYGAESYIGGFSGHVVDLLIIYYGSFRALLTAATTEWSRKVVLDPEKRLLDPLAELNASKTLAPLVIVDPVQQDRNSAAALTRDCFSRMRERARAYLDAVPQQQGEFFAITPLSPASFAAKHPGARVLRVTIAPLRGKKDVVGAKCAKAHEHLLRELIAHGFDVMGETWEFTPDRATLLYAVAPGILSAQEDIIGPPIHMTDAVARFEQAHETTFTHEGRVCALEDRTYRDPLDLLRTLVEGSYVRERVQQAHADIAVRAGAA